MSGRAPIPSRHHGWRITRRVLTKSLEDGIFGQSAQAAFFSVLSLSPLLLALLGSLAYIAPLFGPNTLPAIEERMVSMAHSFFSHSVVDEIIKPTITIIDKGARRDVLSLGFLISLVAGSSAILSYVDAVVRAHGQTRLRHPLRQQLFALLLYLVVLVFVIVTAPLVALGPRKIAEFIPGGWRELLGFGSYPVLVLVLMIAVTILYRVALPKPLPSRRLIWGSMLATVVFVTATIALRVYLAWIISTGYTYGALATPIAFLLYAFSAGFAIMLGAELNAAIQEEWPAPTGHARPLHSRLRSRIRAVKGGDAVAGGV
jgi:membrane protein